MIIKMRTTIAGPDISGSAGQKIDVPEKEAVELVESGYAEYCEDTKVEDNPVSEKKQSKRKTKK